MRSEVGMARRRKSNPLEKPFYGRTAVNYVIDERIGLFYCIVYDYRLAEELSARGENLMPSILGVVTVSANPKYKDYFCAVDYAVARKGYGPLVYDLTARGLERYVRGCQALRPSDAQSPYAQSFWQRLKREALEPLDDDFFQAKYGVPAAVLESRGKKWSRSRRSGGQNTALVDGAERMIKAYVAVGGLDKVQSVPLSVMLRRVGYQQRGVTPRVEA
jgi:hypothetical protein